jgi:hypothetical protein
MTKAKGLFSFLVLPEIFLYAPFGGKGAELRIAQMQQELLNVWSLERKWQESGNEASKYWRAEIRRVG